MGFRLRRRSLLAGALLAAACYSPTLPLPPPGEPEISAVAGAPDRYRLMGRVEANAEVTARNTRTDALTGEVTGGDGRYDFEVVGREGDMIQLWYMVGTDSSPRLHFALPPLEGLGTAGAGGSP